MLAMGGLYLKHVVVAAVCSVLVPVALGSPVVGPEPIRCAPCPPERLSQCPAVAPGCAEVLREPGCGCCLACAPEVWGSVRDLHGAVRFRTEVHAETQRPPAAARPHPRTGRVHGVRAREHPPSPRHKIRKSQMRRWRTQPSSRTPAPATTSPGLSKPYDPALVAADTQESMKAKIIAIRKKLVDHQQAPCHFELQTALDKIAKSQQKLGDKLTRFYLPNCDKHGYYKPKQCESSLDGQGGRCWCVNSWNGKISDPTDLPADAECP